MSDQTNEWEREVLATMRYGVSWKGNPRQPTHEEMPDGYWTPWHLADSLMKDMAQRIAELEAFIGKQSREWAEQRREIHRLQAENAELRADAERYRWLASNFTRAASLDMSGMHTYTGIGRTIGRGLNVSGAIDAAMRQRAEQEE